MTAEVLHKRNIDTGGVDVRDRQLEGEGLVEARAVILLGHLRLLRLGDSVLDHQAHFHVGVCT